MILTLRAVSLNGQPLTQPITARFDASGGTIGRADHSTLALPDPERFISRKQAEIVFVNGSFLIRNLGVANPVNLGNRVLGNGESAMLADGDDVRIGGYLLRAECSSAALQQPGPITQGALLRTAAPALPVQTSVSKPAPATTAPGPAPARPARSAEVPPSRPPFTVPPPLPPAVPPAPARAAPQPAPAPPPAVTSSNPFADLLGGGADDLLSPGTPAPPRYAPPPTPGAGAADPFADLLGPTAPMPAPAAAALRNRGTFDDLLPPSAGLSAHSAAMAAPAAAAARLPDDFDPFASVAAPPPMPARRGASLDPFADIAPVAPPVSIDDQFGLGSPRSAGGASAHDLLQDFEFGLGAPGGTNLHSTDPLAMFDAPATGHPPSARTAPPPMQDNLPGVNAAFEPPRVAQTAPPLPRTLPLAVMPGGALDAALWQAFCDGAGVHIPMPRDPAQAAARLHQAGQVLRAAVEGTRELMAVRASTKYELRAAVTQIQARSNNPLKFAPDTRTGLEQLVQPATRGFLEGPAAMDDAMRDLVGHSIGSVAGMRAALEGLLDRFDPATLEGILGAGSVLDNLVPLNRKARLWELYLQRFRALREEAQEDFHALFGKAFVAAYEQQVARLKESPGGDGKSAP